MVGVVRLLWKEPSGCLRHNASCVRLQARLVTIEASNDESELVFYGGNRRDRSFDYSKKE
jgi:hypothetical protein